MVSLPRNEEELRAYLRLAYNVGSLNGLAIRDTKMEFPGEEAMEERGDAGLEQIMKLLDSGLGSVKGDNVI